MKEGAGLRYPRRIARRLVGSECLVDGGPGAVGTVLDFWQWSASDLLSNATRGRLAEYLVAKALGVDTAGVRDEWAAYDLMTPEGISIEVRSAAYLQAWAHREMSRIVFRTRPARAWDPDTNRLSERASYSAAVYVFALLAHQDKETVEPLNLEQWRFYALARRQLAERQRSQHSINLASLEREFGGSVAFAGLRERVRSIHEGGG